ncbi:TetR/AcrR family transcriptional regulator [Streptomyces variegatus]|uniref:TetR/AcrR family transcriptional regulator n=1 Tax=Streptomyces variegatus TaxID=284040 RepID=UPI003C2BA075
MVPAPAPSATLQQRLLSGLAASIEEKGLAATTIADIVGQARVSKRSFYEMFASKEQAFLALYEAATDLGVASLRNSADAGPTSWDDLVRRLTRTFFGILQSQPALTRAHFLEIYSLGEAGLHARRRMIERYAEILRLRLTEHLANDAGGSVLTHGNLTALIGGISELALLAVEEPGVNRLPEFEDEAVEFAVRCLGQEVRQYGAHGIP